MISTDTSKDVKAVATTALFANFNQGSILGVKEQGNRAFSLAETRLGKVHEQPKMAARAPNPQEWRKLGGIPSTFSSSSK